MKGFLFVFPILALSASAQSLLPIPQLPPAPSLHLSVNTNGYFVFSWPNNTMGSQSSLNSTNVPLEVRSGIIKVGAWGYGAWFLKSTGELIIYSSQYSGVQKVTLPEFFRSNLALMYYYRPTSEVFIGVSKNGQLGIMFGTNVNTFTQPAGGTNVMEAKFGIGAGSFTGFLTRHSNGKIKAWAFAMETVAPTNHIADQLENIRSLDGSGNCGLALNSNGQVFGWLSPTEGLPIPSAASQGVVQVSSPLMGDSSEYFYALKNDGSIVYWNAQGNLMGLPSELSGKQFVKVLRVGPGAALALTRQGQVMGWTRSSDGSLMPHLLPSSLASGIQNLMRVDSTYSTSPEAPTALAQNGQGGLLPLKSSWNGVSTSWTVDGSFPSGISGQGAILDSFVPRYGTGMSDFNFSLSSDGDLAVATYAGLPLDVLAKLVAEKILINSNNFGLATKTEVGGAVTQGVQQVLSAPSEYNLFTPLHVQAERTAGQNDVVANPNQWTLYTTNQIKAMVMGDLMLTRTNNGQFVLNYDIEQSDDLKNWAPYQAIAMPLTNLPTDKAFVRIKLKNQQ